jgi:hypothetical protein
MADPITVGELTDVPAPESPVNAQFHQEVANRIAHRFADHTAMNAWAASNGSLAFVAPNHYRRTGGLWVRLADQSDVDTLNVRINDLDTLTPRTTAGSVVVPGGHPGGGIYTINTGMNPADLGPLGPVNLSVFEVFGTSPQEWRDRSTGSIVRITSPLGIQLPADPGEVLSWSITYFGNT